MNTQEAARLNLERAGMILEEAHRFRDSGAWNLVVRRCQEAVELALKGSLWWAGLEVPWVHDVGVFLRQHPNRFPADFAQQIPRLASISRALSESGVFAATKKAACRRKCSTVSRTQPRRWRRRPWCSMLVAA